MRQPWISHSCSDSNLGPEVVLMIQLSESVSGMHSTHNPRQIFREDFGPRAVIRLVLKLDTLCIP